MPYQDNPSIGLIAQIGLETLAGDGNGATGANKRLRNTKMPLKTAFVNTNTYKGEGAQWTQDTVPGDIMASADSSCPGSFTEQCYQYESAFKKVTPVSGPGGSYARTYRLPIPGVDPFQTYVVQRGNGRFNRQWNYVHWTGVHIVANRQAYDVTGPMVGQPKGATGVIDAMTATPTKVPSVLIAPTKVGLFYAPTLAALESAPIRLTRNFTYDLNIDGLRAPFYPMNELVNSFVGTTDQPDPTGTLDLTLGVDVLTPTTVPARANTTAYIVGDVLKKATGPHTVLFLVTVAGTSAASEPGGYGTAVVGNVITDGTMTVVAIDFDLGAPFRLADIEAGQTFYIRKKAVGPMIDTATGTVYLHQVDCAVQAPDIPDDADQDGLAVRTYHFNLAEDFTAGYPLEVKVVNKLATL
jgi:hypothetical protein